MPTRTAGNVVNLERMLTAWLVHKWIQTTFVTSPVPGEGTALDIVSDQDAITSGFAPYEWDQAVDYELLERQGNLALWRINYINTFTFTPTGTVPAPPACGAYNLSWSHLDPGTSPFAARDGWGCDPLCIFNRNDAIPIEWPLAFVTLSNISRGARVRDQGSEFVVAIAETFGASDNGTIWAYCIGQTPIDQIDLEGATFATSGGVSGANENHPYKDRRAV